MALDAYSVWTLAILVALLLTFHQATRAGIGACDAFFATLCAAVAGLAAGRMMGELLSGSALHGGMLDLSRPKSILDIAVGAVAGAACWFAWRKESAARYFDAAVPAACVAYCIARVGCLIEGCCFGVPSLLPWAIEYGPGTAAYDSQIAMGLIPLHAAHSLPVHPVPVYDMLAAVVLTAIYRRVRSQRVPAMITAAIGYGCARFLLEFLRGDAVPMEIGLTRGQIASLTLVLAAFAVSALPHGARRVRHLT